MACQTLGAGPVIKVQKPILLSASGRHGVAKHFAGRLAEQNDQVRLLPSPAVTQWIALVRGAWFIGFRVCWVSGLESGLI